MTQNGIPDLHPYLQRRREYLLQFHEDTLARVVEHHLRAAQVLFLSEGIRAVTVYLDDIAQRFFQRARETLAVVIRDGPQPYLGWDPVEHRRFWDNEDLDYHWAITWNAKYKIDLLLDGKGDPADVSRALEHVETLIRQSDGLSGDLDVNKYDILTTYLWAAVAAQEAERGIRMAEPLIAQKVNPRTVLEDFRKQRAYARLMLLAARCKLDSAFVSAAKQSFRNLFAIHADLEHEVERLCCAGPHFQFEWAWIWECLFSNPPSVQQAISILRGTADLT